MRPLRYLITALTGLTLGLSMGAAWVLAQGQVPQTATPTCEQQLEAAQNQALEATKAKAQAEFRAASIEQAAMAIKKQLDAAEAKTKAAQGPAPTK